MAWTNPPRWAGWPSGRGGFDEILTIGDSANDVRMIREYGGATLKSAALSVQALAMRVVEDVAEFLEMGI